MAATVHAAMSTVFVVTGASSGVGRALTVFLSSHGVTVIGLDHAEPPDREIRHVPCDLADPDAIDAAVERIGGPIDALANVAGLAPGAAPAEQVLTVNFLGLRHLTERLLGRIRAGGSVVNVAAAEGRHWVAHLDELRGLLETPTVADGLRWWREHRPPRSAYAVSKEAVLAYTTAAAARAWSGGVRMNAVSPGPVRTPALADVEREYDPYVLARARATAGRDAEPDEIAAVIAFLMSNESRWLGGQTLAADGGASAATTWDALDTRSRYASNGCVTHAGRAR